MYGGNGTHHNRLFPLKKKNKSPLGRKGRTKGSGGWLCKGGRFQVAHTKVVLRGSSPLVARGSPSRARQRLRFGNLPGRVPLPQPCLSLASSAVHVVRQVVGWEEGKFRFRWTVARGDVRFATPEPFPFCCISSFSLDPKHAHLHLPVPLPRMLFFSTNQALTPSPQASEQGLPPLGNPFSGFTCPGRLSPVTWAPSRPCSSGCWRSQVLCVIPGRLSFAIPHRLPPARAAASGETAAARWKDANPPLSWTFVLPPLASRGKGALPVGTPQS